MLGGQIHNSSAWPSELPQVFASMQALHANTLEAPVYWEQMEPKEGTFDFTNDLIPAATTNQLSWRISDHYPLWSEFIVR